MGMSSSQARLLSLTARMHDIERKAQKVQAEKLRLANESDRVYDEYIAALDAKKLQYKAIGANGAITFRDATLNALENGITSGWDGDVCSDVLFLQDNNGRMYVTPFVAGKYNLTTTDEQTLTMDEYLRSKGLTMSDRPVYRYETRNDESVIKSINLIPTTVEQEYSYEEAYSYSPVANNPGGIDYEALKGYANFKNPPEVIPAQDPTGVSSVPSSGIDLTGTYKVTNETELFNLANTNGFSGTILLANDITMTRNDWSGIQNFQGTFNGNGHIITGLKGSQGLFASTSGATIANVGLENVSISGNSACVGGLIGDAVNTNIDNCYTKGTITNSDTTQISCLNSTDDGSDSSNGTGGLIGRIHTDAGQTSIINNVFSEANVSAANADGVGGLIGTTGVDYGGTKFDITKAYAIGNVLGHNGVGGFLGHSYNDEDNTSDITDIRTCYAGGDVRGTNYVGGFMGSYLYWGDRGDHCEIEKCLTSGVVTGTGSDVGAFAGRLWVKLSSTVSSTEVDNYLIKFISCGYSENCGQTKKYGSITTDKHGSTVTIKDADTGVETTYSIESRVENTGSADGLSTFKLAGTIPGISETDGSGAYMSNILGVFHKAGKINILTATEEEKSALQDKVKDFLLSFPTTTDAEKLASNTKLWYLNEAICQYLNAPAGEGSAVLAECLWQDVQNGTNTSCSSYYNGIRLEGNVKRGAGTEWNVVDASSEQKGEVTIPAVSTMVRELELLFKKKHLDIVPNEISSYFAQYNTADVDDKARLAYLNDLISNSSNTESLYSMIKSGVKSELIGKYETDKWEVTIADPTNVVFEYGKKVYKEEDGTEQYWDTTDPDVANAIAMYNLSKKGIQVVSEEEAASTTFLRNYIINNFGVLTTFNPENSDLFSSMSSEEIAAMDDHLYDSIMGIKNTSIAESTSVEEVSDDSEVKKAEAKYEADMRRISRKDRQYDTELTKFDNIRNALKEERETLQTVIRDNVELNFKLFS